MREVTSPVLRVFLEKSKEFDCSGPFVVLGYGSVVRVWCFCLEVML